MPGCGSGVLVSSSSLLIRSHHGRCQAKIPLSPPFKFAEPPLTPFRQLAELGSLSCSGDAVFQPAD